jgi:hypothetical protein
MPDEMRFVFAAYAVTWIVILGWTGYAWRTWRRARALFVESHTDEEVER